MRLFSVLLAAASGALLWATWMTPHQPHCPTEDSCAVSYDHGKWTVTEVAP